MRYPPVEISLSTATLQLVQQCRSCPPCELVFRIESIGPIRTNQATRTKAILVYVDIHTAILAARILRAPGKYTLCAVWTITGSLSCHYKDGLSSKNPSNMPTNIDPRTKRGLVRLIIGHLLDWQRKQTLIESGLLN
jgi:hypothetical protein